MGRDRHYVPGDFYRVDDRTGFPERAKRTRKEWTGLIVHRDRWEARHPQDFVKGVFDDQTVPEPRPLPTDLFVGPLSTSILAEGALFLETGQPLGLEDATREVGLELSIVKLPPGATAIPVASLAGMQVGDTVEIMLDTFVYFKTTISTIVPLGSTPGYFTIPAPGLPYFASSGNIITDLTQTVTVAASRAELSTDLGG